MKPDGRVDVFAGTVDIGQGSKTVHTQIVADTLGVPYDRVNDGRLEHRLLAALHGHVRLARHVHRRLRRAQAAKKAKEKLLEIAGQAMEIAPADLEVEDGVVFVKGSPDKKMTVGDVSGGRDLGLR